MRRNEGPIAANDRFRPEGARLRCYGQLWFSNDDWEKKLTLRNRGERPGKTITHRNTVTPPLGMEPAPVLPSLGPSGGGKDGRRTAFAARCARDERRAPNLAGAPLSGSRKLASQGRLSRKTVPPGVGAPHHREEASGATP